MGSDDFSGYGQQDEQEDGNYSAYSTSVNNMNNVLNNMRTTSASSHRYAPAVSTANYDDADDDDVDNARNDTNMDSYLLDDGEEENDSPNLLEAATTLLMTPLRRADLKVLGQISLVLMAIAVCYFVYQQASTNVDIRRPDFVNHHPYVSSSYYASTQSLKTLLDTERLQVKRLGGKAALNDHKFNARVAVVRPFCEFDAEALPSTFAVWNQLPPCRASATDLDLDTYVERNRTIDGDRYFDSVGTEIMQDMVADVFLFYSQTFSENEVAIKAVDTIIDQFNEPGGWSQCFANIYAIEANIPQELDLYIPSAQEELYNWVNGPNRQFEAAFRIIQSGEWGDYDGFYLMEGDSIPIKNNWLDVVLSEIESNRPFAILGAKYNGDKWDNFYEQIPLSLIHHINGNAIYNTSHPLLERLVGQLEVEAPCPYNSIPYDYRMSQMVVEGAMGIVPELAPKIMLNEEGENITLSNNTEMFTKWWDMHSADTPFKETPVIHNYAATNLIPRHLGPEYIIHGAKLYAPWNPTKTSITLVIAEWFHDRSTYLLSHLDEKDHPFSEVVVMLPPNIEAHEDYDNMTVVPTRSQHRSAPDYMDICEAEINTEWFMLTNSYHKVASHVDLMFVPGTFKPVVPFTPATYAFCFKFPYCKESVNLAQRFSPGHEKVVLDFDILYHTKTRNEFCKEWKERFGPEGENLYKGRRKKKALEGKIIGPSGPTGTSYAAYLAREGKDALYKFTDRSLYGARDPFVKVFAREERLDGMSEELYAMRDLQRNLTASDCNCKAFETEGDCDNSGLGCIWRPLFDSCRPPELIDGGTPICAASMVPTIAPTVHDALDDTPAPTETPTEAPFTDPWYASLFKTSERERDLNKKTQAKETDGFSGGQSNEEDIEAYMRDDNLGDLTLEGENDLTDVGGFESASAGG
eukprot:CAMPEP_0119003900 /NCGR_PEP_ID=MMETSP1176-20130426/829_1 /TAXON_ID=265551 /ORGANISM="Synedropsis recta cf, Strain CCMP1620" /LENGTH=919 /DNA_ID=CAMNT_0006955545 /DNA_START=86 /DNA_END=2845 /DNA_ORIENTATION=-